MLLLSYIKPLQGFRRTSIKLLFQIFIPKWYIVYLELCIWCQISTIRQQETTFMKFLLKLIQKVNQILLHKEHNVSYCFLTFCGYPNCLSCHLLFIVSLVIPCSLMFTSYVQPLRFNVAIAIVITMCLVVTL